ncbi:MAG: 30S ribosomal protein S12 methylthiotransferase RimO [Clostridia bacterium]|nr:30S ribosomal protein S12 methylthiotransferase RimO [Clostridia bacterium]
MQKIKKENLNNKKMQKPTFFKKVGFVSLGCDKNRVDTENIVTVLSSYSCFEFVGDSSQANIIIINTCAFLKIARDEAKSVINQMAKFKTKGNLEKLIVCGCLPLLLKEEVLKQFKSVDAIFVPQDYDKIDKHIFKLYEIEALKPDKEVKGRVTTTPRHYSYLKVADGCNNRCAYCKIPFIRGFYKSQPLQEVINEAQILSDRGSKELILVAQDLTRYGCDIKTNLVELLQQLAKIKNVSWLRLLYCYPEKIDDALINEIKENPKVVKYIDVPLQHVSNNVLKLMKRRGGKKQIVCLIKTLRKQIKDIKIRTTFMVGFPGETKKDFKELCVFLKKYKLDNVGFFKYSRESGTTSYDYENQVDELEKDRRLEIVQKIQHKIAQKQNKKLIGKTLKVLCDSYNSKYKFFIGRPYFSAPEIDFEVWFKSEKALTVGSFIDVKIVDFKEDCFIGEVRL